MPIIAPSRFRPPWWLAGPHRQTLWPALVRRVSTRHWWRERLELPDGDFLDVDRSTSLTKDPLPRGLVVIAHGLEGNSRRAYVAGLAWALNRTGWDTAAWNFRGCSGEPNRTVRSYHSGATEDLAAVLRQLGTGSARRRYRAVVLAGFSLGGNLTLKYLAELGPAPGLVAAGVVFSVPCDLASAAGMMSRPVARPYLRLFLRTMNRKAAAKVGDFPHEFPAEHRYTDWAGIRNFREFDDHFTAPLHGFRDADDYWTQCSAKPHLHRITVPVLLINSLDDPFLAPECFPTREAAASQNLWLETPAHGGHVGFRGWGDRQEYWHERRAVEFLHRHVRD